MKRFLLTLACLCGAAAGCEITDRPVEEERVTYTCAFSNCTKGPKTLPAHAGLPSCCGEKMVRAQ